MLMAASAQGLRPQLTPPLTSDNLPKPNYRLLSPTLPFLGEKKIKSKKSKHEAQGQVLLVGGG